MKTPAILFLVTLVLSAFISASAQSVAQQTRPRTVSAKQQPVNVANHTRAKQEPAQQPAVENPNKSNGSRLAPNRIRARIEEAKRMFKTRPHPTAMTSASLWYVTIAAMVPDNSHIHLIRVPKETFLKKGSELPSISNLGLPVTVRILRANGVNTAVTIFDEKNRALMPLVIEYPIERKGVFREMAYYTSAHPALLSADLTKAGHTSPGRCALP